MYICIRTNYSAQFLTLSIQFVFKMMCQLDQRITLAATIISSRTWRKKEFRIIFRKARNRNGDINKYFWLQRNIAINKVCVLYLPEMIILWRWFGKIPFNSFKETVMYTWLVIKRDFFCSFFCFFGGQYWNLKTENHKICCLYSWNSRNASIIIIF